MDGVPPLIYVKGIKLHRDFAGNVLRGRKTECVAVSASQRTSLEVEKLENALSAFFDIPILLLKEIYDREFDAEMQILSVSSNSMTIKFKLIPELVEVGLQMRISHLVWELNR